MVFGDGFFQKDGSLDYRTGSAVAHHPRLTVTTTPPECIVPTVAVPALVTLVKWWFRLFGYEIRFELYRVPQ